MASSLHITNLLVIFFFQLSIAVLISNASTEKQKQPKAFILPTKKDKTTLQYYTSFEIGSPKIPINALINLGGHYLGYECSKTNIKSYTYKSIHCDSDQCNTLSKNAACAVNYCQWPGCLERTCALQQYRPFNDTTSYGMVSEDELTLSTTDGLRYLSDMSTFNFTFLCLYETPDMFSRPTDVTNVVGLGSLPFSLPNQLASKHQQLKPKFALCLYSGVTEQGEGNIFIGGGPYFMSLKTEDLSKYFVKTPLFIKHFRKETWVETTEELFIGVSSIKIDNKVVNFDSSLLSIREGENETQGVVGGTKLDTFTPYTILHSSIYKPFVEEFVNKAVLRNITRVASVGNFGSCFSSKTMSYTKAGPRVPKIDLVLQNKSVRWSIYGGNSMVKVNRDVWCLGFVDGGSKARTSIVIGGLQMENNLLEFDLVSSTLSFTSSLLLKNQTCKYSKIF